MCHRVQGEIVNQDRIYNITLKVKTDGVYNDLGGNVISENNVLSGISGTKINLKVSTNSGYRFVGYQSFLESGNSTDGLLPIENDSFEISDKTGNVTVVAMFEKIPIDETIYFSDEFSTENINNYLLSENLIGKIAVSNGKLNIHAPGVSSIKTNSFKTD